MYNSRSPPTPGRAFPSRAGQAHGRVNISRPNPPSIRGFSQRTSPVHGRGSPSRPSHPFYDTPGQRNGMMHGERRENPSQNAGFYGPIEEKKSCAMSRVIFHFLI